MFIRLLQIESFKLIKSFRLYFTLIAVVVFLLIVNIQYYFNMQKQIENNRDLFEDIKINSQAKIEKDKILIDNLEAKQKLTQTEKKELASLKLQLESLTDDIKQTNIYKVSPFQGVSMVFASDFGIYFLLPLIVLLVVGGNLAEELHNGTIKILLIKPVPRWKILLSKWITSIIYISIFVTFEAIMGYVIGGIFFGFSGWNVEASTILGISPLANSLNAAEYIALASLYSILDLILIITTSFLLSLFISSPIVTTIGTMIFSVIGIAASDFMQKSPLNSVWAFSHLNFTNHFNQVLNYPITYSVFILILYILVLLITSFYIFEKKNFTI